MSNNSRGHFLIEISEKMQHQRILFGNFELNQNRFLPNNEIQFMDKKKEEKEAYATEDPTDTDAKSQEEMAKEAIKKFKSLS